MNPSFRTAVVVLSIGLCASIGARKLTSAPLSTASQENSRRNSDDDESVARAARLYYSTKAAGLKGFDCAVHPDWRTLIQSSVKNSAVSESDPNILMLKRIAITLHARLNGHSTIEWKEPPAEGKAEASMTATLDQMHKGTEQALNGFMQFWTPFVDGSMVNVRPSGMDPDPANKGESITIHIKQRDADMTEVYSKNLILQHVGLMMNGSAIDLSPSYDSTNQGLLVSRFVARIRKNGAPSEKEQEMHVEIYYRQVDGFPIPARLNVEVVGTAVFNFQMDGCRVNAVS